MRYLVLLFSLLVINFLSIPCYSHVVEIGEKAPLFEEVDQAGTAHSLNDYQGFYLCLVFIDLMKDTKVVGGG